MRLKLPKTIPEFTKPELDRFRELCNFNDKELEYFDLKAKNKSIIQISMEMSISEASVSYYAKKVKDKMLRVI